MQGSLDFLQTYVVLTLFGIDWTGSLQLVSRCSLLLVVRLGLEKWPWSVFTKDVPWQGEHATPTRLYTSICVWVLCFSFCLKMTLICINILLLKPLLWKGAPHTRPWQQEQSMQYRSSHRSPVPGKGWAWTKCQVWGFVLQVKVGFQWRATKKITRLESTSYKESLWSLCFWKCWALQCRHCLWMKGHCKDEEGNFFPHLHREGQ